MKLFQPIYYTKNPKKADKAIVALSTVESADELYEIYRNVPLDEVAYAALDCIKNQRELRRFLDFSTRNLGDKKKILDRITDVTILKDILQQNARKDRRFQNKEIMIVAFNRLPEPDSEEIEAVMPVYTEKEAVKWVEHLKYPEDRDLLFRIMKSKVPYYVSKAAAKQIPVSRELQWIKENISTMRLGSAEVFFDCLKMPEDKEIILEMLKYGDSIRIKAAELLAQDETMRDYRFCPYCGRPARSIHYGYLGYYGDMFYYGWSCPCGHRNSAPEGYGEPENFAVTIEQFVKDPEGCMK